MVEKENSPEAAGGRLHYGVYEGKSPRGISKCSKLKVPVLVNFADGFSATLQALVDTGAEFSLINPKCIDASLLNPSLKPIRLGVANSHRLSGGQIEATMTLTFDGMDVESGQRCQKTLPLQAYDAEVVCDLILSYGWMAEHNFVPHPRRHDLKILDKHRLLG